MSHLGIERLPIKDILEWLLRGRDPVAPLDPRTGRRLLPYRGRFLLATSLVVVLANAALGFAVAASRGDLGLLVPSVALIGLTWIAAMIGAWDVFMTRVWFGNEGITLERASGSRALVPWSAMQAVRYSRLGSRFVFQAPGYPTVRVSIYRSGLRSFAIAAERGLAASPLEHAPFLLFEKSRNP